MKPNIGETYESWANRVQMFEQGNAMMQIAQGKDMDKVMEEMSRRIMDKLLHPIFRAIREASVVEYDSAESIKRYKEKMANRTLVADHVDTEN